MTKRYKLTARAEMHGTVREPGYVFSLGEGELGPHRTVRASNHGAQLVDHIAQSTDVVDIPLYVEIDEHGNPVEAEPAEDKGKK
jgi:hypothetical protein